MVKNENLSQKLKCWSKIKILAKNRNFGHKSQFWTKKKIYVKNGNLGQQWKFWSKIESLVKIENLGKNSKCLKTKNGAVFFFVKEILASNLLKQEYEKFSYKIAVQ